MISRGQSPHEIETFIIQAGLTLPKTAYIDKGLHNFVLGRNSILGSAKANLKAITGRRGLSEWLFQNSSTILGYGATMTMFGSLISPAAAVTLETPLDQSSMCALPAGTYQGSCHDTTIASYHSADINVPGSCVLTTKCSTIIPSIPHTENTFYFAKADSSTLELYNVNGTLSVSQTPGTVTTEALCSPLSGSFTATCQSTVGRYISTDPNVSSPLCQMQSSCKTLGGKTEVGGNSVYYAYKNTQIKEGALVAENCDGRFVIHSHPSQDGMCEGKTSEQIRSLSFTKGKTHRVLGEGWKDEL
jgi:hypothetical protein